MGRTAHPQARQAHTRDACARLGRRPARASDRRPSVSPELGAYATLTRRATRRQPGWMIDLHSHILPGLDDGAATVADSLALARAAAAVGVTAIAATPHVRDDYPTSPDEMEQAVGALGRTLADAGLAVQIVAGG